MTPDLSIFLGQSANNCDKRIGLAVTATTSAARVESQFDLRLAAIDLRVMRQERDMWRHAASVSFFERPVVVATITGLIVTVVVGIIYLSKRGTEKLADEVF